MKKVKIIFTCNCVVWVLAAIYSFVPYKVEHWTPNQQQFYSCSNAWGHGYNAICTTQGRLAQIVFWAGVASSLVTAVIIILENYRKQSTS